MRTINEIIEELKEHPDYCIAEIHTWSDIIELINDDLQNEGEEQISIDDLSDENRNDIEDHILYMMTDNYNHCSIIPDGIVESYYKTKK